MGDETLPPFFGPPTLQQEYVFRSVFIETRKALQTLTEDSAMLLGSAKAHQKRFEPSISDTRLQGLSARASTASLDEIADATQSTMLEGWKQDRREFVSHMMKSLGRDVVRSAEERAQTVKERALQEAAAVASQTELPELEEPPTVEFIRMKTELLNPDCQFARFLAEPVPQNAEEHAKRRQLPHQP